MSISTVEAPPGRRAAILNEWLSTFTFSHWMAHVPSRRQNRRRGKLFWQTKLFQPPARQRGDGGLLRDAQLREIGADLIEDRTDPGRARDQEELVRRAGATLQE